MSTAIVSTAVTSELAVEGGAKVRTTPWPVRHLFGQREKTAVMELFDHAIRDGSHLLGYNGEQENRYCQAFAEFLGGGYADGVNSGTNAVYVALRSLDLEPYSEVIVPPISDPGGVMPVALIQCIPVTADGAPGSYNTGAEQIAARLTKRTRAIIVAHIAGIPVDMDPVLELAKERGLPVIEDCAQAHGASYQGRLVGSLGDIAAFSTMFGKHHATGGQGGVVFTRSQPRYWRIRQVADRGKPFGLEGPHTNGVAALNCNMDEIHAAIGWVQLQRLPEIVARRRQLARRVEQGLKAQVQTVRLVTAPAGSESAYWFFFLRIELDRLTVDKVNFAKAVAAEGVPIAAGYWSVPSTHEWFRNRAVFGTSRLPWSKTRSRNGKPVEPELPNIVTTEANHMVVPLHEDWTDREVEDLVETVRKVEAAYLR
ncbi:MAG: DegT/DnrJ/EryC1/StrS family aminotransferase [Verrucomicrobia bacterium]|nr:DegT/DnrJ/EryC1/StrS family aminotransferase [Verrucomicrobiota bacterium]